MIPRVLWRCAKPRNGRTKKPKRPRQSLTTKDTKVHEGVAASKGATSSCSFVSFVGFSPQSMRVALCGKRTQCPQRNNYFVFLRVLCRFRFPIDEFASLRQKNTIFTTEYLLRFPS